MQTLLAQNAALENENANMESAVRGKDAELENFRKGTPKANSPDSEGSSRPPVSPQQRKAEFNSIVQEWLATVSCKGTNEHCSSSPLKAYTVHLWSGR